jgi:hypothetical protein
MKRSKKTLSSSDLKTLADGELAAATGAGTSFPYGILENSTIRYSGFNGGVLGGGVILVNGIPAVDLVP